MFEQSIGYYYLSLVQYFFPDCVQRVECDLAHADKANSEHISPSICLTCAFSSLFTSRFLRCTVLIGKIIMASSSRETSIDQHISGLTVTDGAKLFSGIYNSWYSFQISITTPLMLHSGPVNLRNRVTKTRQCMLVLDITFILFSNL